MNPLRTVCLLVGLFALAYAGHGPRPQYYMRSNSIKNSPRPSDWLRPYELESLPSFNEISFDKLEQMPVQEGAEMLNKLYHLAQVKEDFEPSFAPRPSEISAQLFTPNKPKVSFKLNELPRIAREQKDFGEQEVTVFITGLPQENEATKKATRKLVDAYMQRYNSEAPEHSYYKYDLETGEKRDHSSNEEEEEEDKMSSGNRNNEPSGNLVVIDLGSSIPSFKAYATLDIEETGANIGDILVQLTDKADVAHETVHVIGSNIGAHVAGAAGRQYTRETGHQLRRITGLDPSKIYARRSQSLTGLARGDAEFVDVIHTSAYGLGVPTRHGDADFYPNGPSADAPGTDNVIEASVRAIRYYAESVVPGNEHNFPAVGAISLSEYKNENGYGKRVYMGIDTDYDVEGDFVLEVNAKSPFGRKAPTNKQKNYHSMHKPWKLSSQDY